MDALLAKADFLSSASKKRRRPTQATSNSASTSDLTYQSLVKQTSLPKSLRPTKTIENVPTHNHIANKKLRSKLARTSTHAAQSKALLEDAELLLTSEAGKMEVEGEMEKTWRVGQSEIVASTGQEAALGRKEWKLDGGPYKSRYTRNGRSVGLCPISM